MKNKKKKVVYATMAGDLFHRGHLEFIKKISALGDFVIIGLHPDDVVKKYKRNPIIPFEDRKAIIGSVRGVDMVVEDCMDSRRPTMLENIKKYKVDMVVHGNDWLPGEYKKIKRLRLCKVVQVEAYPDITTTAILEGIRRRRNLKTFIDTGKKAVLVSAGDAITARLVEEADFDGIWVSGFEVSARLGLTDNGSITMTDMLNAAKPIVDAASLPVIVDTDNGYGGLHNFVRTVREFEKIGCAGICVEDNVFPKQNSLWGGKAPLLSMREHGMKIRAGKAAQNTKDFIIVARTEALIRGYGMTEAVKRARYYAVCGADMVMIHTREATGKEALAIPGRWGSDTPLVIVPTKFPQINNSHLFRAGFSVVVLANQTERIKIKAIRQGLRLIKENDNTLAIEKGLSATLDDMRYLTPIKETEMIERRFGKK
ncbi:MAG: isocitrate lyase/phosphoenolpyruvate mutase family protein [Candidatus Omnitrophota bacterium]|jgi:phosphoenolpyruvate phosphomutase